jgi:asparagine synthase (glutamine-hydrolysing)
MCGIAAFFSAVKPVRAEPLRNANTSLRHRGPDNQNLWIDPEGMAGLAHARLSLLDLSPAGDQPLSSTNDRLKLIHNGEFYDFERIRRECEGRGRQFHTHSDSEVLLPLYEERGVAALEQLRGEFAFVLWDRDNRYVFAARDRFGIKPLFYALHDGVLYFASEVKTLFAMGIPPRWDTETVYFYHATGLLPPHRTLYRDVLQIPPGHFLTASARDGFAHPRLVSYWDFDYAAGEDTSAPVDALQAIGDLTAQIEEAVRLRLRADVPVACYLSGGVDSCSLLGIAARHSAQPIHAFTLAFRDDKAYDESDVAKAMAESCGAAYHEIPIHWRDLADSFADALAQAEIPFVNTNGAAKFLLSRAVREAGFKAVLTGEGADEIFAGYEHFGKDVLPRDGGEASHAKRLMQTVEGSEVFLRLEGMLGFVPTFIARNMARAHQTRRFLARSFRAPFRLYDAWRVLLNQFDVSRQISGRPRLSQSLYLWSKTMLANYLLTVLGDRMEMAHSIEGRLPFLDHKLVEQATRLPGSLKINAEGTQKYILREATREVITSTVYGRLKHPFQAPPAALATDSPLFQLAQDTFRSEVFSNCPFYDQAAVIEFLDRVPEMSRERQQVVDRILTAMLSFALLQQRYGLTA